MDISDILIAAMVFVSCLALSFFGILALVGVAIWFINLEPATQIFYAAVFIIAFVLSAAITYHMFK